MFVYQLLTKANMMHGFHTSKNFLQKSVKILGRIIY